MIAWISGLLIGALGLLIGLWLGGAIGLELYGRRSVGDRRYDAIVVAGCRVRADGRPSAALARRVRRAVELHRQGVAPKILLTGGQTAGAPVSEARSAAALCGSLGISPEALVLEEESRDTLENAAFAARLLQGRILVVSDRAHLFRCRRMFGRHFEEVGVAGVAGTGWPRARLALIEVGAVVRHGLRGQL